MDENDFGFGSHFAEIMAALVSDKRARGYPYNKELQLLRRLDRMWQEPHIEPAGLTQKWAERFIALRPTETSGNGSAKRASVWRQLAKYASNSGLNAYFPDPALSPLISVAYTPFIYTRAQLAAFFRAVDGLPANWRSPRRPWAMGLLYRLLYGAGLRLREALELIYGDFDSGEGTIVIRHPKNGKARSLPLASSLVARLKEHINRFPDNARTPFFHSVRRKVAMHSSAVEVTFPDLLRAAGLPPRAKRAGPRIHDLRHTFAVHRMENWLYAGEDLNAKLPVLSAYMGHAGVKHTYYYLRLTHQMHPNIAARFSAHVGDIVPTGDEW